MSAQEIQQNKLQLIIFSLEDQETKKKEDYGVAIEQVREIRSLEAITKIPNAESYVKGIMNLRGQIIPIIDVKEKLGYNRDVHAESNSRVLVAEVNGNLAGFLVDDVDQVMRISSKDVQPPPTNVIGSGTSIIGVANAKDRLIILLDLTILLGGSLKTETQTTIN